MLKTKVFNWSSWPGSIYFFLGPLGKNQLTFQALHWINVVFLLSARGAVIMASITPFKTKAEERSSLVKTKAEGDGSEKPAKKQCNAYEKQIASMEGDTSLVKD